MSNWQEILRQSVTTVDELIDRFGAEAIGDPSRVQQAIDNFNLRITPAALKFIEKQGDAFWTQYVPTDQELEVHDGIVDSLDEDGDSPDNDVDLGGDDDLGVGGPEDEDEH